MTCARCGRELGVLAATEGDLGSLAGTAAPALAALTVGGIVVSVGLAARTVGVLDSALRAELGPGVGLRRGIEPGRLLRVLLAPLRWRPRDVVRVRDVRYGPAPGRSKPARRLPAACAVEAGTGPARFPDQVVDAKRVIAWLRAGGGKYGADPSVELVVGGSAGGHLVMMRPDRQRPMLPAGLRGP